MKWNVSLNQPAKIKRGSLTAYPKDKRENPAWQRHKSTKKICHLPKSAKPAVCPSLPRKKKKNKILNVLFCAILLCQTKTPTKTTKPKMPLTF